MKLIILRWLNTASSTYIGWVVITTLYHLMLQSWYQKHCSIIGEHVVIMFLTQ